jgi:hypothetical protein
LAATVARNYSLGFGLCDSVEKKIVSKLNFFDRFTGGLNYEKV